jgi:hypothetical protein
MEFIVKTDLSALSKTIDFNYEEMKQELAEKLTYYNNLAVTEDSIKAAKADKAKLNTLFNAIEDKRKEVKKECMQPYMDFEAKCKEITALIKEPVDKIDGQIKFFDQQEINEKLENLKAFYFSKIGDLEKLVPLERILNPKWQNKTVRLEDLKIELENRIDGINADLKTLSDLNSEYTQQMQDCYLKTFNLSAAIAEGKRLEEQKKYLEEMERKREERNAALKAKLEADRAEQAARAAEPVEQPKPQPEPIPQPQQTAPVQPKIITTDFRVVCTVEQLNALGAYMRENGIKYGRVPKEV